MPHEIHHPIKTHPQPKDKRWNRKNLFRELSLHHAGGNPARISLPVARRVKVCPGKTCAFPQGMIEFDKVSTLVVY